MQIDTSKISKTTLLGLLLLLITAMNSVKFDMAGHLCMTQKDWFMVAGAVVYATVAKLQKDAK